MIVCDSSILVAALCGSERQHSACKTLLTSGPFGVWVHGFVEAFNTLTGGRIKPRPSASSAATAALDFGKSSYVCSAGGPSFSSGANSSSHSICLRANVPIRSLAGFLAM